MVPSCTNFDWINSEQGRGHYTRKELPGLAGTKGEFWGSEWILHERNGLVEWIDLLLKYTKKRAEKHILSRFLHIS